MFVSLRVSELLQMGFLRTSTGIVIRGIKAELVESEIIMNAVGIIFLMVSVLCIFGLEKTKVDCVWSKKPGVVLWIVLWVIFFSVIVR